MLSRSQSKLLSPVVLLSVPMAQTAILTHFCICPFPLTFFSALGKGKDFEIRKNNCKPKD
jgi:hypothetical protein